GEELSYDVKEAKPDEMIDLATLTGAVVIALGQGITGLFASHDGLSRRLLADAETAGERMWRLPLFDDYKEGIKSDVADLNNVSRQRGGGGIVAGGVERGVTPPGTAGALDTARTAPTQ